MITEPVFEHPELLTSLLQRAQARLAAKDRLPDLELALIVERHRGKILPDAITSYLTQHFRGKIRAVKGPKLQSEAEKDFRFGPAANLYRRVLPIFKYLAMRRKRRVLKRRISAFNRRDEAMTPSQRSLDYVIERLKDECDLRTISGRSLANAISEWQREIERREFPVDEPTAHPTDEKRLPDPD